MDPTPPEAHRSPRERQLRPAPREAFHFAGRPRTVSRKVMGLWPVRWWKYWLKWVALEKPRRSAMRAAAWSLWARRRTPRSVPTPTVPKPAPNWLVGALPVPVGAEHLLDVLTAPYLALDPTVTP